MAMTLRLSPTEDEALTRLARSFRTSKNLAAATAIDLLAPREDHADFVRTSTQGLLHRYDSLMQRLAEA